MGIAVQKELGYLGLNSPKKEKSFPRKSGDC